jgi:multicomponent Na+:H+ antiporter subunit E
MFRIDTDLKGDIAKLCQANSITLTPGTLTVDTDEKGLLIHSIDLKEDLQSAEVTGLIPESFEQRIKEVFE